MGFFSVSLNIINGVYPNIPPSHAQQATLGLQLGFSHTNSHFGLGQTGLAHFQSHLGSSHTASHSGFGAYLISRYFYKYFYLTMSNTVWHFANCYTFRTIFCFTCFIWAFNFAFWFFAFNITYSVSGFLTTSMTSWWSIYLLYFTRKLGHIQLGILDHRISKRIMDDNVVQLVILMN